MPPPMKLTKEMVDAMGGPGSDQYKTFTDLCFSAFFHLRRSVNKAKEYGQSINKNI